MDIITSIKYIILNEATLNVKNFYQQINNCCAPYVTSRSREIYYDQCLVRYSRLFENMDWSAVNLTGLVSNRSITDLQIKDW